MGHIFKSVEAAYQAAKCKDKTQIIFFVDLSPGEAKKLGRKVKIRNEWEDIKVLVMEELLEQKFKISPYKELLLSTEEEILEEGNNWKDTFWGICPAGSGVGKNMLGKLLMKIRDNLRKELL